MMNLKKSFREAREEEEYKYEVPEKEGAVGGEDIVVESPPEYSELGNIAPFFPENYLKQQLLEETLIINLIHF